MLRLIDSLVTLFTVALFAAPIYFALTYLKEYSLVAYVIVGALLLKPAFLKRVIAQGLERERVGTTELSLFPPVRTEVLQRGEI